MALDAAALGSELEAAVRSSQGLDGTPYPQLTAYCTAIAGAIVDHFVANAELSMAKVVDDTPIYTDEGGGLPIVGYTNDATVEGGII